jgi:hypothetical protein
MSLGELLLILIIVFVVFGSIPQIDERLRRWMASLDPTRPRLLAPRRSPRWTTIDWLLVSTTVGLAITLAVSYAYGR